MKSVLPSARPRSGQRRAKVVRFRVWILRRRDGQSLGFESGKPVPVRLESLSLTQYSQRAAQLLAEGFNRIMLAEQAVYWAVAIPAEQTRYAAPASEQCEELPDATDCPRRAKKARRVPVRSRRSTGLHRGNISDASCGVPAQTTAAKQPHH